MERIRGALVNNGGFLEQDRPKCSLPASKVTVRGTKGAVPRSSRDLLTRTSSSGANETIKNTISGCSVVINQQTFRVLPKPRT